jgi:hypothetical protein
MNINFTHTPDDLLRYNLYFQRVSAAGRRRKWLSIVSLIAIGVGVPLLVHRADPDPIVTAIMIVIGGTVIVLSPCIQYWSVRRAISRALADPRLAKSFGDIRVSFNAQGLHPVSPVAETDVKWPQVADVVCDSDDYRYICFANGAALIVSRRSYHGPVHFDQLKAELERLRNAH